MILITHPIPHFLTPIPNPNILPHDKLQLPPSKIKTQIPQILNPQAFIPHLHYLQHTKQPIIPFFLKYPQNNQPVITPLKTITKPPLRLYPKSNELP
ncbi:30S ribosomal protein S8, partial [Bacillus sp. WP8]|uniref:30S ribosomal protein S8 n=1 Tax=Bacillus sp. WP8 TaxID=756828 RepID=UPI00119FEC9B